MSRSRSRTTRSMISKLRATGGAGFSGPQPSQDRILGPQTDFGIYKPLDVSKIDTSKFIPRSARAASKKNTTIDGKVYGVLASCWGASGLVVNKAKAPNLKTFADLVLGPVQGPRLDASEAHRAARPGVRARRRSVRRLWRQGRSTRPSSKKAGAAACRLQEEREGLLVRLGTTCSSMLRSGEVVRLRGRGIRRRLQAERRESDINFVAPTTGALGWIDYVRAAGQGQERRSPPTSGSTSSCSPRSPR